MHNGLRNLCYAVWTALGLTLIAHELCKPAAAQSGGSQTISGLTLDSNGFACVITSHGDLYIEDMRPLVSDHSPHFLQNFWTGAGPTVVTPQTWSQIKGQYAPKSGSGQ